MNRIDATFAQLRAARPHGADSRTSPRAIRRSRRRCRIMHALVAAGADVIELGVPFSDPMADGPVIQRASERALAHGVSLRDVLGVVARVPRARRDDAGRADGLRESDRGDGRRRRSRDARARRRRRRRARRRLSARGSRVDSPRCSRARASRRSSCSRRRRPRRASRPSRRSRAATSTTCRSRA